MGIMKERWWIEVSPKEVEQTTSMDALKHLPDTTVLLLPEQVEGAFQYYQAYPEEIDHALAENRVGFERLKQMFPQMQRITVSLDGDASAETGA